MNEKMVRPTMDAVTKLRAPSMRVRGKWTPGKKVKIKNGSWRMASRKSNTKR